MAEKNKSIWFLGLILLWGVAVESQALHLLLPDFAVEDEMVALQGYYGLVRMDFSGFAFYKYPGLLFLVLGLVLYPAYLLYNLKTLVHLQTVSDLKYFLGHPSLPEPSAIYLGRVESLAFGLVAVWFFFMLFRKRLGERASLWGALFLVSSPGWLFSCSLLKNDSLLLLSLMLLVYACYEVLERGRSKDYLLSGVGLGLCLALKFHIFALAPLLFAHWLRNSTARRTGKIISRELGMSLGLALLIFFIFSPAYFLHPARAFEAMLLEMAIQSRALPLFRAGRWWWHWPVLFQLFCVFPLAMGIFGYLTSLFGASQVKNYLAGKNLSLFFSYPAVFFAGWAVISRLGYPHLYLPLLPFLAALAGMAIDRLLSGKWYLKLTAVTLVSASMLYNMVCFKELNRAQSSIVTNSLEALSPLGAAGKIPAFFPYRPLAGSRYHLDFEFLPQFLLTEKWLEKNHPLRVLVHQTYYLSYLNHPDMNSADRAGFEILRTGESGWRREKEWEVELKWGRIYACLFPDLKNFSVGLFCSTSSAGP
jgi:hypothetical protein